MGPPRNLPRALRPCHAVCPARLRSTAAIIREQCLCCLHPLHGHHPPPPSHLAAPLHRHLISLVCCSPSHHLISLAMPRPSSAHPPRPPHHAPPPRRRISSARPRPSTAVAARLPPGALPPPPIATTQLYARVSPYSSLICIDLDPPPTSSTLRGRPWLPRHAGSRR
ncbi:hypothetical protein BRADI_3g28805v3 [Brachypodium distachyon]|uniref:Uncharacterized protein n=1 Tax=Brachypodium distachyon TaxID=15368 RepID=A0A2K2CZU3_BRADI|nr:hypothetical protein BRADI_3g28805v3 [Brachypodium distachyon]